MRVTSVNPSYRIVLKKLELKLLNLTISKTITLKLNIKPVLAIVYMR